jgi:hypothetical protein
MLNKLTNSIPLLLAATAIYAANVYPRETRQIVNNVRNHLQGINPVYLYAATALFSIMAILNMCRGAQAGKEQEKSVTPTKTEPVVQTSVPGAKLIRLKNGDEVSELYRTGEDLTDADVRNLSPNFVQALHESGYGKCIQPAREGGFGIFIVVKPSKETEKPEGKEAVTTSPDPLKSKVVIPESLLKLSSSTSEQSQSR